MTRTSWFHSIPVVPAAALLATCLLATLAPVAFSQIGRSARIEGLGSDFAGIVDDALTDAALNPARLGAVGVRQAYFGLPTGGIVFPRFPRWQSTGGWRRIVPIEGYFDFWDPTFDEQAGADRVRLTYFTPVANGMEASFSLDVASEGADRGDGSNTVSESTRYIGDGISLVGSAEAQTSEAQHVVFDAAVTTSRDPDKSAFGVRVSVEYLSVDESNFRQESELESPKTDLSEQVLAYQLYKESESLEEYGASATLGWYRASGTVRELSVRMGGTRISRDVSEVDQNIFDEDADGNGIDPIGVFPVYRFDLDDIESARDLSGGELSGRLVLDHGEHWRSVHGVNGTILGGDGEAEYATDDMDRNASTNTRLMQGAQYSYDSSVTRLAASSAFGYVDELVDDVMLAVALRVVYDRDEFDEDGTGAARLEYDDGAQSATFGSPYEQRIRFTEEDLWARLSVAAEWTLPKYLTFRIGLNFKGSRHEVQIESDRQIDTSGTDLDDINTGSDSTRRINWETDVGHRAGLSVRLADRLFVDMYTGSFEFARFSYGTVRLTF